MRVIDFDGHGQPRVAGVVSGQVLILLQGNAVSIVRLRILSPKEYGPELEHATNDLDLVEEARAAIQSAFPRGLPTDRHWTLECPADLAARAEFPR